MKYLKEVTVQDYQIISILIAISIFGIIYLIAGNVAIEHQNLVIR